MSRPEPRPPSDGAMPLSREGLRAVLAAHALWDATAGREGRRADLTLRRIEDFDFSGLALYDIAAPIYAAAFLRCRFVGTDFYFTVFRDVCAPGADFQNAQLPKAEVSGGDFRGASFDGANLLRVNFFDCDLRGATFRGADLSAAGFSGCDLGGAVFDEGVTPRLF